MARASSALTVEIQRPDALTARDADAWMGIQNSVPAFANPLFGQGFAVLVGQARADAHVAVFRRNGAAIGFLAHHRRPGGFARPIGAPFSDYQGLVSKGDIGITGAEALKLAGLGALRFNGLVDPHGLFLGARMGEQQAYAIELAGDADAYLEQVRTASPKKFKNYRRLEHRMEREIGPLRFVADDRSQEAFDALMAWKSEQFRRTGIQDVLRPQWVRGMMQSLFETHQGPATGLMVSLYAGETLVAGHFGVRQAAVFHPWVASANPELGGYSPGQAFLGHAIRAMPAMELDVYDLGPGHDHYKRPFASTERVLGAGLVTAAGMQGRLASARESAWTVSGLGRLAPLDKVRRRLDHIAAVDPSVAGRVRGLAEAMAGATKRGLGNDTLSDGAA